MTAVSLLAKHLLDMWFYRVQSFCSELSVSLDNISLILYHGYLAVYSV
jgi:hypothetical protein